MSLSERLAEELERAARRGETVGYGDLARRLSVPGPGAIARVTEALEDLMAEDAAAGRPLRAALCRARLQGDLPAPGFFEAAARLGRYTGPAQGPEAQMFAQAERSALYLRHSSE